MNVLTADGVYVRLMRKTQHYQVSELSFYEKSTSSKKHISVYCETKSLIICLHACNICLHVQINLAKPLRREKRISLCFEFMNVLTADAMHVRLMRKTQHYQVSELSFYEKAQKSTVQQKAHLGNITHSTELTS